MNTSWKANKGQEARLGIDIGRVIISPGTPQSGHDTSFIGGSTADAMATPSVEGAFEVIRDLVALFEGRVWLVSKAGWRVRKRTKQWLNKHHFYEQTGIPEEHLRFCFERHEKAEHCEELGLTHFIDDRTDVLRHLKALVPHLLLFGPQKKDQHTQLHWCTWMEDWRDVSLYFFGEGS